MVDVDSTSSSAPVTHLLSEGDFRTNFPTYFPADTKAALKQETKP